MCMLKIINVYDILIINVNKTKLWVENLRKSVVIGLLYIYTDNMVLNKKKQNKKKTKNKRNVQ